MNVDFGFSNLYDFPSSMIIKHTSALLFLHFETPYVMCFSKFNDLNLCLSVVYF